MPPCLTLSIIGYVSRVKWSNPGNVEANEKGAFGPPLTTVTNFTFYFEAAIQHFCNSTMVTLLPLVLLIETSAVICITS